ncbi:MAG: prolipoprotein diacylglyceryl transferase [Candidatus Omnitrophica bacterium]|nr:prolipoprotein diacylglyceryl transferase [Candidatus Omnitrophota bacterium]MDD5574182.1 prolipoprotein diacylglyceryl transferase [Candidatus Omnitrophota bacterium]
MAPVLYSCSLFTIYTYGVFVAAAFVVATWLITRQAAREGFDAEIIGNFAIFVLVSGILSARLFYVVLNWEEFSSAPLEIVKLHHGGLVWFGGLIGAALCAVVFLKIKRLSVPAVADLCAPYLALAQGIGRIGCFFNGCCYGKPSVHGMFFPAHGRILFPSQIVDALTLLAVYMILRLLPGQRAGRLFGLYLILAGLQRFLMEFMRGDERPFCLSLSIYQWISLGLVAAGLMVYALTWGRRKIVP